MDLWRRLPSIIRALLDDRCKHSGPLNPLPLFCLPKRARASARLSIKDPPCFNWGYVSKAGKDGEGRKLELQSKQKKVVFWIEGTKARSCSSSTGWHVTRRLSIFNFAHQTDNGWGKSGPISGFRQTRDYIEDNQKMCPNESPSAAH